MLKSAQSWIEENYQDKENIKKIFIRTKNLEGDLLIQDFPNLEWIEIRDNFNITSIKIINNPKLIKLNINGCQVSDFFVENCHQIKYLNLGNNELINADFFNNLNLENLIFLSLHSNNFNIQSLEFISNCINVEELYLDNSDEDKFNRGILNRFTGSLEPLNNLKKLKWLSIAKTDISHGLDHLSNSVIKIGCKKDWSSNDNSGCSLICKVLENAEKTVGVTEKLIKEESDEPLSVKGKETWYRMSPWHQLQDLLLEKKPLVQKLREQLNENRKTIEILEKKHFELKKQLDLAIREEEEKKFKEKDRRIQELEELVRNLTNNSPNINISPNFFNTINNSNNQFNYQISYDGKLLEKELEDVKRDYRELEINSKDSTLGLQKFKKTILFLVSRQIFSISRQKTINSLVEIFNDSGKSDKKYNNISIVCDYASKGGDLASFFPPLGIPIKVISTCIPIITDILKNNSLYKNVKKFEDYLFEDEKSLILLQETYQSLDNSLQDDDKKINPLLINFLNFDKRNFNQHSVFVISENLKENFDFNIEDMKKTIDSLSAHLVNFTKEFNEEAENQSEKMIDVFSGKNGEFLQNEIIELLEKLSIKNNCTKLVSDEEKRLLLKQIEVKKNNLNSSIKLMKSKLESRHPVSSERKKRNEKRESIFEDILITQEEIITTGSNDERKQKLDSLKNELLNFFYKQEENKIKLEEILKDKAELVELQLQI